MSPRQRQDPLRHEGEGYLASVADLMSGLLFVFIITVVVFAIDLREEIQKNREETRKKEHIIEQLTNNREVRRGLLEEIREQLARRGIQIEIDPDQGVLRLTERAVRFPSGKWELSGKAAENLAIIAEVLAGILPCYANSPPPPARCDAEKRGRLEAVFIEGHTDNVRYRNRHFSNWDLSVKRAITTYRKLTKLHPQLDRLQNRNGEALFSVSGYADRRPVVRHETTRAEERNRRIDLRFIMTPPSGEEAEAVREVRRGGAR